MQFDNFIWKKKSATSVQQYNKYDAHNVWGDDASDIKIYNLSLYFLYIELLSLKNLLSIVTMHIKLMIIYFLNDLYCKYL